MTHSATILLAAILLATLLLASLREACAHAGGVAAAAARPSGLMLDDDAGAYRGDWVVSAKQPPLASPASSRQCRFQVLSA